LNASELAGIPVENLKEMPISLQFDLDYFYKLIEPSTKLAWQRTVTLSRILEVSEYYTMRRLFTYEADRVNSKREYAELTPKGKLLPDWFVLFKSGRYERLTRKEQAVAYFNQYNDLYLQTVTLSPNYFEYAKEIEVDLASIQIHQ
jgi:hypothetical protein